MEKMNRVAPAHNPPYIAAMRLLERKVAGNSADGGVRDRFSCDDSAAAAGLCVPFDWAEKHSGSPLGFSWQQVIATSPAAWPSCWVAADLRIISCHLGGSNSLCAIRDGKSVASSMGMSPQSGLPQNNRVGDFDPFALPVVMQATGKSLEEVLERFGRTQRTAWAQRYQRRRARFGRGGRRRKSAGEVGDRRVRDRSAALFGRVLGRTGRGRRDRVHRRHRRERRTNSCSGLRRAWTSWASCSIRQPTRLHKERRRFTPRQSRVQLWVVPTNEEIVVARQVKALLEGKG